MSFSAIDPLLLAASLMVASTPNLLAMEVWSSDSVRVVVAEVGS